AVHRTLRAVDARGCLARLDQGFIAGWHCAESVRARAKPAEGAQRWRARAWTSERSLAPVRAAAADVASLGQEKAKNNEQVCRVALRADVEAAQQIGDDHVAYGDA